MVCTAEKGGRNRTFFQDADQPGIRYFHIRKRLQCPAEYHVITQNLNSIVDGDGRIKVLCFPGLSYFGSICRGSTKPYPLAFKLGQQGIEGLYGPRKLVHRCRQGEAPSTLLTTVSGLFCFRFPNPANR